jgi:hypothetical protein
MKKNKPRNPNVIAITLSIFRFKKCYSPAGGQLIVPQLLVL